LYIDYIKYYCNSIDEYRISRALIGLEFRYIAHQWLPADERTVMETKLETLQQEAHGAQMKAESPIKPLVCPMSTRGRGLQ
jgi:hypothetical protein